LVTGEHGFWGRRGRVNDSNSGGLTQRCWGGHGRGLNKRKSSRHRKRPKVNKNSQKKINSGIKKKTIKGKSGGRGPNSSGDNVMSGGKSTGKQF